MTALRIGSLTVVALLLLVGTLQPSSDSPNLEQRFQPPRAAHLMGTDQLGRDVWNRGLRAMARSVAIAAAAWLAALVVGTVVGATGALTEDRVAGRAIEGVIAVAYTTPLLLLLVGIMSLIGRGAFTAYLIVAMVAWAPVARHSRAIVRETLRARFVAAGWEMGFGTVEMTRYVLIPSAYRSVLIASLPILPELIAIDAALSFFGFGPPPPTPTIGGMVVEGLRHLGHAAWILAWPVGLLAGTCLLVRLVTQSCE